MPVSQGETMPALVGAEKIIHLNHRTKQERVHLIKLSQAIEELAAILGSTTKGTVLHPLYDLAFSWSRDLSRKV